MQVYIMLRLCDKRDYIYFLIVSYIVETGICINKIMLKVNKAKAEFIVLFQLHLASCVFQITLLYLLSDIQNTEWNRHHFI